MNKRGISKSIIRILESTGGVGSKISEHFIERVYNALVKLVIRSLIKHGHVRLPGLGIFTLSMRSGRRVVGFNKEEYRIDGYPIIKFKAAGGLAKESYTSRCNEVLNVDLSTPPKTEEDDEFSI